MPVKSPILTSHARMAWDVMDLTTFKRYENIAVEFVLKPLETQFLQFCAGLTLQLRLASASVLRFHNQRIGQEKVIIRLEPAFMILWALVRLAPYRNIQNLARRQLRRSTWRDDQIVSNKTTRKTHILLHRLFF